MLGVPRRAALAALIAVCACSSPGTDTGDDSTGPDGHELVSPPLDGMQTQGRYLLGEKLDALGQEAGYHANATTAATTAGGQSVTVTFDGSAALRAGDHRGADRFFDGMQLRGSEGAVLRITGSRGGSDLALYQVEVQAPGGWVSICDNPGDEAIPLAGKWQKTGFHEAAPDRISFACAGSVAFKCSLWGYLAGGDPGSLGWRAHQACTRMARGDYCANGHTHTRNGTHIKIYDFAGVTAAPPRHFDGVANWPPDINHMYFEAAWNDAAHPASCLSRLRWQSLPLGTLCDHDDLRDPRQDTGVRFCEDLEWPAPGGDPTGALLFNASYYTDMALHVWKNGDDVVSTVRGYFELPDVIQPFPAIAHYDHVRSDGIVGRVPPDGVNPADYVELHLYGRPGDLVVAAVATVATTLPADFRDLGFEGYAAPSFTAGLVAFQLFHNRVTGDYLSTTGTPVSDYDLVGLIGYVLPPEAP